MRPERLEGRRQYNNEFIEGTIRRFRYNLLPTLSGCVMNIAMPKFNSFWTESGVGALRN